ncbi:MAG: Na/Pi cotransporter family protein [Bacteriovoracaceae bacterium]
MNLYAFFGGFGLFYFGFRLLLDSLAQAGENLIRDFLNRVNQNHLSFSFSGLLVTFLMQSSRTATLMTMGLVNASLLKISLAIAFILGANVGATSTVWLFAISSLSAAFFMLGIGILPKILSKNQRFHLIGHAIFGLGLIFLGFHSMEPQLHSLSNSDIFRQTMLPLHETNFFSLLYSLLIGMLVSLILESSNLTIGLVMLFFLSKIFPLSAGVAMVLGANLGSSLLALIAALNSGNSSRKAAWAHILFNLTGLLISCLLLKPILQTLSEVQDLYVIPLFHTLFNLGTAVLFFPFIHQLIRFLDEIFKDDEFSKETPQLVLLGNSGDMMPATAIIMAEIEIKKFKDMVTRLHKMTREYLILEEKKQSSYDKIKHYENITDNMQKEITLFLGKVMERALTQKQSIQTRSIIRMADELESVADYLERLAFYKTRFDESFSMKGDLALEFFHFYDEMMKLYEHSTEGLFDVDRIVIKSTEKESDALKIMADDMRDKHLKRISRGEYSPISSLTYSDMVVAVRKIRLNAVHLARSIHEYNQTKI